MTNNVSNQFFDYAVNARASYSPDAVNSASAPAVNGWTAVEVSKFFKTSPDFSAQMYTDGQGNFRFSMRGSETSNYAGDFRVADAALMVGKWDAQLADGIRFVGEAILQIKATPTGSKMSLDDIRAILDGSGHSLGGAIYEAAASFWGLRGMSIDGPGVAKQIVSAEFQAIKEEFRARGLTELQDSYEWQTGDFQARRYTVVGAAEIHADGVEVYTSSQMGALLDDMNSTPSWAYGLGAAEKYAWETVRSIAGHPMGAIFKLEGLADVDLQLLQLEQQRNVQAGLSASGYPLDTVQYEPVGNPTTSGAGSTASTSQSVVQITTYKDPSTGAIMEVRLSGAQVDDQFVANATVPLVIGMDIAGRTVLTGAAAQIIAAAQLNPIDAGSPSTTPDPAATTVTAPSPWSDYSSVSIQNHASGGISLTFQGEIGQTAWVLSNGSEGGRTVVLTSENPAEGEARTVVYDLDAAGVRAGQSRYYDGQGLEVTDTGAPLPVPSEVTYYSQRQDITNASGSVTRMVDVVDKQTGQVLTSHIYENTDPSNPDGFRLVGTRDYENDTGWTLDRETGQMQREHSAGPPRHVTPPAGLQLEDLDIPALASQFAPGASGNLNLGGAYGAGQINGFDILPFSENAHFLLNSEGDIVAELTLLEDGSIQFKSLSGESRYVIGDKVFTQEQYEQAQSAQQTNQAASALGLMNSVIGLQHWDAMTDLQRVAAVASIYNAADALTGGNSLPGNLAAGASMLGLLSALDQGNAGAAMISGISLVNSLTNNAASNAIGAALSIDAANVVPVLGLILALDSGDPVSIIAAAANFIPVYGQIISICIIIFGSLFGGDDDIPMSEGAAHAQWDAAGNLQIVTDQNEHGGGSTAQGWMSALANGLQGELARHTDEHGNPIYGLVPNLLPTLGFKHDPDGFNYQSAQGHLFLSWVDENGQTQTRYYDGAGNRNDDSGETLAGDFMKHAMDAIAPAWAVQTTLAHWQAGEGMHLPTDKASLPQESADGITQTLQVLTLAVPGFEPPRESLIDVDGDGYLEATQWVQANQAMLAIDVNGDGYIGAGELLNLVGGDSFNSLTWLDADGDGQLNASDPAFAALRLWMDVNGDGISPSRSGSETQTLAQAGITAIDFSGDVPRVEYADGSTRELTAQMLTADTLGVSYQATQGGLLEISEQADGSGAAVLSAINTREFDGAAGHVHGGEVAPATDAIQVEAGDERLASTGNATVDSTSDRTDTVLAEGDARLRQGESGTAVAGQPQGPEGATVLAGPARRNAVTFVPLVAALPGGALADATTSMVRCADVSGLDAATWAAVAAAAGATSSAAAASVAEQTGQALGEWPMWTAVRSETASSAQPVPAGESAYTSTQAVPSSTKADASPLVFVREREWSAADRLLAGGGMPFDGVLPGTQVGAGTVMPVATQPAVPADGASSASASASTPAPTLLGPAASSGPVAPAAMAAAEIVLAYPVAVGERLAGREDTGLRILAEVLLANDTTANMSALRIVAVDQPRHGQVSMAADGSILFVPYPDFHGEAGFRYTVSDDHGLQHSAWAGVDLASVNDAPVAHGEMAEGDEDRVFHFSSGSLLANDTDADITTDGDVLRIGRVDEPQHGSVELLPDGSVRFEPDANYHGPASFIYWVADVAGVEVAATVSLSVHPVNDLPVVTGEVIDNDEDVVLRIDPALLLANDTDVDTVTSGQVLAIGAVGGAQHGSVALLHDGRIEFTPEANHVGNASFAYRVDDGAGGQLWTTAVLVLAPVNDAPVAVDDSLSMDEDTPLAIEQALLLANDSDIDNLHADLRIVAVDHATHGTVSMDAEGALHFVPEADYFGSASFTYTVSDGAGSFTVGTARIEVAPVNDAPRLVGEQVTLDEDTVARFTPVALLANDSDVDNEHAELVITGVGNAVNGTVALAAGEIVFTPTLNHFGPASFTYTVSDGVGGLSEANVALTFDPVNDVPVANGELLWGKRDVSYTLTQAVLLANDTDVEDPTGLRIVGISNVQNGSAVLKADGSVNFVPEAGFSGLGRFDYIVQDPQGAQSVATAQIDFSRINVTPVATDDSFIDYEDVPFSIPSAQLLANDSDADNPASELRVAAVADAVNGTVSLDAQGQVRFVPVADHVGTASFRYRVEDSDGGGTWATAVLTVQAVNDAPVIEDIWHGRPFYGYRKETQQNSEHESYMVYVKVTDPATAKALLASGQSLYLQHSTTSNDESQQTVYSYTAYASTYYRNGMVRPLSFDSFDALNRSQLSDNDPVFTPVDDRFRQNGAVVAYDPDGNSAALVFGISSTPQHGHVWANRYIPSSTSEGIWYPNVEPYGIPEVGVWQYFAHLGDSFTGADPFTISVADSGGATTHVTINASHLGSSVSGGGGGCPIVIDLANDGIDLIRPEDSNVFVDINEDGWRDRIGWAAPSDAVLVLDANLDDRVDIDHEVSFVDHLPGARTDLEGLAAHDSNGDGRITAADERWQDFGLFQDRNGNGVQDEGEFVSLDAARLRGISLMREGVPEMNQGNVVFGTSAVEWADGRTTRAGDVMFVGDSVPLPEAAVQALELAQIAQMALLFNQVAALPAHTTYGIPAAFVPPVMEDVVDGWVVAAASAGVATNMAGAA